MAKKKTTKRPQRANTPPTRYRAFAESGPLGIVRRFEPPLSHDDAVQCRVSVNDVVVVGTSSRANKETARLVAADACPNYEPVEHPAHPNAGKNALPHWHSGKKVGLNFVPDGHTFWEAGGITSSAGRPK